MARRKVRDGREKYAWEKAFAGTVRTQMDIYNLNMKDMAKVLGIGIDNFSIKMNDPGKFRARELCKLLDFLHIDRAEVFEKMCKGEK